MFIIPILLLTLTSTFLLTCTRSGVGHSKNIKPTVSKTSLDSVDHVRIYVLVDNYPGEKCKTAWGIGMLVVTSDIKILFDAGPSPETLKYNAEVLDVNVSDLDFIVISHEHGDHVRGLEYIARVCKKATVYVPEGMSGGVKSWIKSLGFNLVEVKNTMVIAKGIAIVGQLYGPPYEQALAINVRDRGLILLVGCSHPGVENIAYKAYEDLKVEPYMVIGGFHMGYCSRYEARETIRDLVDLGAKRIAPIHCSGSTIRSVLEEEYPEYYLKAHVCSIIDITSDC